jgi:hypothetical protein
MTTATKTPKKRTRRSRSKRAAPLAISKSSMQKAAKIGGAAAGAWIAGKALMSGLRVVVGTALVVAAAAAAATFIEKDQRDELIEGARDFAVLAYDRARSLNA